MRFLRWLLYWPRYYLGLLPPVQWADGKVVDGAFYAAIYADTVAWVRNLRPDAVQTPEFKLTVRIYDRWPKDFAYNFGKVLAPNTIPGDTGGTLCLAKTKARDTATIIHEAKHAITGITDHPAWLFAPDGLSLSIPREAP